MNAATQEKTGVHERIVARLMQARETYGRDAMRRVEHAFLHYARLRPRLPAHHPMQQPTWMLPGVSDYGPYPPTQLLPAIAMLEQAAPVILEEAMAALEAPGAKVRYDDGTPHQGKWSAVHLRYGSRAVESGVQRMPRTSALIASLPNLGEMAMLSVLAAGCHIQPHCGLHNYRWTAHLGLRIPSKSWFCVGGEKRQWEVGRCLLFDDSYRHEARNEDTEGRLILLVDFWHPELRDEEVVVLDGIANELAAMRVMPGA